MGDEGDDGDDGVSEGGGGGGWNPEFGDDNRAPISCAPRERICTPLLLMLVRAVRAGQCAICTTSG